MWMWFGLVLVFFRLRQTLASLTSFWLNKKLSSLPFGDHRRASWIIFYWVKSSSNWPKFAAAWKTPKPSRTTSTSVAKIMQTFIIVNHLVVVSVETSLFFVAATQMNLCSLLTLNLASFWCNNLWLLLRIASDESSYLFNKMKTH